jgi:hypothetical protein
MSNKKISAQALYLFSGTSDNDEELVNKVEREPMRVPSTAAVAAIAGVIGATIISKSRQSPIDERIESNKKKYKYHLLQISFSATSTKPQQRRRLILVVY